MDIAAVGHFLMIQLTRRPGLKLCSLTLVVLALSACNQSSAGSGQTVPASTAQALPPPPAPPPVPRYNRTADQEQRWRRYLEERRAYDAELAQARAQGRYEQQVIDQGRQGQAFDVGRQEQAASDRRGQSNAFNARRHDQGAADQWRQAGAFTAGRVDQARIDQAQRDLAAAYHDAHFEPDPGRRAQMVAQARAELAAAQHGQ